MIDDSNRIEFEETIRYYLKHFISDFRLLPVIAGELEFYTKEHSSIENLQKILPSLSITKEDGHNQFEIQFSPKTNPLEFIEELYRAKELLHDIAIFDGKPFENQPGSGLHIHINFLDQNYNNVFEKQNGKNPKVLGYVVAGLLRFMKESCVFFAPAQNDYLRYSVESMNSPSTISWGVNNRTASLRITTMEKGPRRIEHRVASSNAEAKKVVAAIFAASYFGLTQKIYPQEPTYGRSFDPQYNLEKLPKTLEEAEGLFMEGGMYNLLITKINQTESQ